MVGDNMQFLLGSLTMAVFFVALMLAYRLGRGKKPKVTPAQKDEHEKERRKAEALRVGFDQLMKYDVKTALSGEKVI